MGVCLGVLSFGLWFWGSIRVEFRIQVFGLRVSTWSKFTF